MSRKFWSLLLAVALAWPVAGGAGPPLTLRKAWKTGWCGAATWTPSMRPNGRCARGRPWCRSWPRCWRRGSNTRRRKGGAVGAYPFNVLWALAHIPSSKSLAVLEKHHAATKDPAAALALKGWWLRRHEDSSRFGVLINDGGLLERPGRRPGWSSRSSPAKR